MRELIVAIAMASALPAHALPICKIGKSDKCVVLPPDRPLLCATLPGGQVVCAPPLQPYPVRPTSTCSYEQDAVGCTNGAAGN